MGKGVGSMLRITVKDDFLGMELTGEFESVEEAKAFYAVELDTFEEDINIIKIEKGGR